MMLTKNESDHQIALCSTASIMPRSHVSTFGLTHLALGVRDPAVSFEFYHRVFGMIAVFRDADFIQAQTPGARDVLVFERVHGTTGTTGSIAHFGFRLTRPEDIGLATTAVRAAGGRVIETGEFVPGEPYAFVRDLDGYTVEIWYEIPTSVDPE
jgi:catechol 2,3-dioxygenase-like lactoylglutathione lyase family enzyme